MHTDHPYMSGTIALFTFGDFVMLSKFNYNRDGRNNALLIQTKGTGFDAKGEPMAPGQ